MIDGSQFFNNDAGTEGAAITTSTFSNGPGGAKLSATGEVRNSVFKNQGSLTIRDIDADNSPTCEINEVVYNDNEFYTDPPDGDVYLTSLVGGSKTASELNDVTVVRPNCGVNTHKSTLDNTALAPESRFLRRGQRHLAPKAVFCGEERCPLAPKAAFRAR